MSTGSSALAARPARRSGFLGLRGARLRVKIAALLLLPLIAVFGLASMRLLEVTRQSTDSARVAKLAELGAELSHLGRLLHDERMAGAEFLSGPNAPETGYRESIKATDAQTGVVRASRAEIVGVSNRIENRLTLIDRQLTTLTDLRAGVGGRNGLGLAEADQKYGEILASLAGYESLLSLEAARGPVTDGLRALAAFNELETAAADQAALTYVIRSTGDLGADRQRQLIAAQVTRADALAEFRSIATPAQVALVDGVTGDPAVGRADELSARLTGAQAVGQDEILDAFGDVLVLFRGAERQLEEQVVAVADEERTTAARLATIEFIGIGLIVIAAVSLGVYLGRSLLLSVRRLREGALGVANRDLPVAVSLLHDVEGLNDGGVERIVSQTRDPIQIHDQDEFGEVAEAFNMVHREAIRIAAEQAAMRTSLSTMFLSLARRSQTLVDRMIGELDQIERMEEDPKRLARLFELDHLATRMRRNDENLLVLAGAEVGTPRREDALLIDALRAAQSEVELYHRIEFGTIDTDVLISAAAVNDVVRLIAELLDNATRFSSPETVVMAHGGRAGAYAAIRVEDRGLGISPEQMETLNRRLSEPAEVDVTAFRLMGFAVIARLASRHGIQIELHAGSEGGTVAEVTLPADIVVLPGVDPFGPPASRAASWTRPGPPPQPPVGTPRSAEVRPPVRTAPVPPLQNVRPLQPVEPMSELDLEPTPDRPRLPTRVPKPVETAPPEAPPVAAPTVPQEMPASLSAIQVEMQHSWFSGEDEVNGLQGMPTAGYAPPPSALALTAQPAAPPVAQPAARPAGPPAEQAGSRPAPSVPKPRRAGDDRWRTSADEGWQRARAASAPKDAGNTLSGLPKRIPQAQLVPGGVQTAPRAQQRRNPDEVRGLLSAYHRGVQRGRTDGEAETAATATHSPKERDQ